MSAAMEPMKVPLCGGGAMLNSAQLNRRASLDPLQELQKNNEQLVQHSVLLKQQNDLLMRNVQCLEKALHGIVATGPPSFFVEPANLSLLEDVKTFRNNLSKESSDFEDSTACSSRRSSNKSNKEQELSPCNSADESTTCFFNGERASIASTAEVGLEKKLTQVIVKNLKSDFTRTMLLNMLEVMGYTGKYDMLYLPVDFETKKSYQYAFVNFLTEEIAQQFQAELNGCDDETWFGPQACETSWSGCQGLLDTIEKYRNSPVMHPSVPDDCKPMIFVNGKHVAFPRPTKKISKPRQNRHSR